MEIWNSPSNPINKSWLCHMTAGSISSFPSILGQNAINIKLVRLCLTLVSARARGSASPDDIKRARSKPFEYPSRALGNKFELRALIGYSLGRSNDANLNLCRVQSTSQLDWRALIGKSAVATSQSTCTWVRGRYLVDRTLNYSTVTYILIIVSMSMTCNKISET